MSKKRKPASAVQRIQPAGSPTWKKRILNWFSKRPQTKAAYIAAIASVISLAVLIFAAWYGYFQYQLNRELAERAKIEKVEVQFHGGDSISEDYETKFFTSPTLARANKTLLATRWPVIISNNGENTISIVGYEAVSRIHGAKRNIETRLLDQAGSENSALPLVLSSGASQSVLLEVPIHVPDSVFALVKDRKEFQKEFTPAALDGYLKATHNMDFYGNRYRYARKRAGSGPELLQMHVFKYNPDGDLTLEAMQADQVRIEFKTARSNYFAARTLYYQPPSFKPSEVKYLEQGKPGNVPLTLESLDSLPKKNAQSPAQADAKN